jgi:hypothetical protein
MSLCPLLALALQFFPSTRYLDYAVRVEEYTLQKSSNLVRFAALPCTAWCELCTMMR